jgi:hypothetical protein
MLAPREVSIYLNNALTAKHVMAELDSDTPLPEVIQEMPRQLAGHFVGLDEPTVEDIKAAWKHVMRPNTTPVLYDFYFEPETRNFTARRR